MYMTTSLGVIVGRAQHVNKGQQTCKGCHLGRMREVPQQRLTWKCRSPRGARSIRSLVRLQPLQLQGSCHRAAPGRQRHPLRLLHLQRPSSRCGLPLCRRRGRRSLRLKWCRLPHLGGQLWKGQHCRPEQVQRRLSLRRWLLSQLTGIYSQRPNGIQGPSLLWLVHILQWHLLYPRCLQPLCLQCPWTHCSLHPLGPLQRQAGTLPMRLRSSAQEQLWSRALRR